ncbi:MAG: endonuclease [Bacteroidia bacterium]|nr:endonuclease [Bacteroidia bacterium]
MKDFRFFKTRRLLCLYLILLVFIPFESNAQNREKLQIAFWNLENFFDPFVDSTKIYNEFTENGTQHWTKSRFYKKRNNVYKTVLAISGNEPLAVMGIAEVENQYVLNMVFNQTPLKKHNYRIIHYEGDDRRGIDVAMVYCIDKMQLVYSEPIKIRNPNNDKFRSRDILYAKFSDRRGDTLHVFVNHWPSRYGGEMETIELRALAANTLKHKVDSLCFDKSHIPKIIIMGDFNDTPDDPSIRDVLGAKSKKETGGNDVLVNLFTDGNELGFEGTLKHQFHWQIFDQIIVSRSVIEAKTGLKYKKNSALIFHADFLFQPDEANGGVKLFRTYIGPKYFGGYSDHLPVRIFLNY